LLKIGQYVWNSDDTEIGMIEHIEITQTDKEMITASGRFATALLDRRIIWGTEMLNGDIGACVGLLVTNHLINPTDPMRGIDYISYNTLLLDVPVHAQVSYKNLLDTVTELCDAADVGIRTTFDPITGNMMMSLYKGTAMQAVFSREFENLISQSYIYKIADARDTVLVAGEGEGDERMLVSIIGASGE
jgi:hypothetical protein